MEISLRDVDDYLATLPVEVRHDMVTLDSRLSQVMSGLPRELWLGRLWGGSDQEIIGYGRVASPRSDGSTVEWFMVGLARQKNYLSVYISAVEDGQYLSEKYGKDLGRVKVGKSSLGFKQVDDIDLDKLASLAERARELSEPT